jgi:hypothetical protein
MKRTVGALRQAMADLSPRAMVAVSYLKNSSISIAIELPS